MALANTQSEIDRLKRELVAERNARMQLEKHLREKELAMEGLFRRMDVAGVDYSDLIP